MFVQISSFCTALHILSDSLLRQLFIGYKVLPLDDRDLSTFHVTASAYSIEQKAFVAHTKEAIVWYDYEKLKKCIPDDKIIEFLRRKVALTR